MVTATAERVRLKDGPSDSWKIDGIAYYTKTSSRNEITKKTRTVELCLSVAHTAYPLLDVLHCDESL